MTDIRLETPKAQRPQPPGPDRVWVERAARGDREAFGELARRYYALIHASATRLLGNADDAEDLAQECFVRAHRALRFYRGEGSFVGWLRRILVHLARDRFRSAGRRPVSAPLVEAGELTLEHGPAAEARGRELERVLRDALDALPTRLRIPLALRALDGLAYDEIAQATGVTPQTARTQVMKARRALRRLMQPYLDCEL